MEQFRQRVAATCHIGPLDLAETEAYVGHRLKCADAGAAGPDFEATAFEAIFKASQGIPRRINSICDRVLLLGFMEGRKRLTVADVNEVVREFTEEAEVPARNGAAPRRATNGFASEAGVATAVRLVNVDLPRLKIDSAVTDMLSRQLGELDVQHQDERLQRLEQGQMRLEQINLQVLATLQELVRSIARSRDEGGS